MCAAYEELRKVEHDNPLTQEDIRSALEIYSKEYYNFTIADIEKLTDIRIERNKRNGRKQSQHVKVMNAIRDVLYPDGEWREKGGRPSVEQTVINYIQQNPTAKPKEIIEGTGLSRNTVYKYYKAAKEKVLQGSTEPSSSR